MPTTIIRQRLGMRVPMTITPFTNKGPIRTLWCGPPHIVPSCPDGSNSQNESCRFTIEQTIRVAIPVEFGANASLGDIFVNCGMPTASPARETCSDTPAAFPDEPEEVSLADKNTCPLKNMQI